MQKLMERRAYLITQIKELTDRLSELELTIAMLRGETEAAPTPPAANGSPTSKRRKNVKRTVMALVDKAGITGVTADEVIERARDLGYEFDRPSVSSLLSKFKAAGALTFDGERYYPAKSPPTPEGPSLRIV
jgi:hypothetical protein